MLFSFDTALQKSGGTLIDANSKCSDLSGNIFQHTESTFSFDPRQSMKRRITAKHLTEPK